MSQLHEDLLAPRITKKRIIAVVLVTGFLISFFTFSVYLTSFLFGTQRIDPSEKVEDADYDEYLLVLSPLPFDFKDLLPDDFDLDDLKDLGIDVDNITPEDLEKLAQLVDEEDIADFLEEMNDGDIDNFDLTEAGLLIAALLFSDVEVFRVYRYDDSIEDREDILWRYECFDQFNGDGWESTVPKSTMPEYDFPTVNDYLDIYRPLGYDDIMIKRILSTNPGTNSFVMGTLFPEPYLIEETISADNLNPDPALSKFSKDDMECVIADLYFNSAENVSFYNELFGWGVNPNTNEQINNTAVNAIYTPNLIKNQFLKLPPNIGTYKINNPFFNAHWNALNSTINVNDNAFMVANKIRNYLQSNFELSFDEMIDDPPVEGEDVVEWFCEKEEGLYSEFASAFCAFTRSFGVASRFVNGYNSRLIEEEFDNDEGLDTYAIKYKNIYDWAEIFVPGHGQWVQMDILYETFGLGGSPIMIQDYNLTVTSNATQPFSTYNRGDTAKITAILNSTSNPVDGRTITFTDESTGELLGSATTNGGIASIEVNVSDNHIVGPNIIKAEDQGGDNNFTVYVVDDNIEVVLQSVTPQEVNISELNPTTRVIGYVEDPFSNRRVPNAAVNFTLLYKGTTTSHTYEPFYPSVTTTDAYGAFDEILTVQNYVPYGEYDIRVDFNGSWILFGTPFVYPFINNSSNIFDFNVTREITYDLHFSVNGRPTEYGNKPLEPSTLKRVKRGEELTLSVIILDSIDKTPVSDRVEFYDYTNGDFLIGSDVSDTNGNASISYNVGDSQKSGPNLVYAKIGGLKNYSYYIVDESFEIVLISGPVPRQVNITVGGSTQFNIAGYIQDDKGTRTGFTEIELRLFDKNGNPYPNSLISIGNTNPYITGSDGSFNLFFEVDQIDTPVGNYTLRMDFNGTIDLFRDFNNPYKYTFDLNSFSNSSTFQHDLKVFDPDLVEIFLYVENDPVPKYYSELDPPKSYNFGDFALFNVTVTQSEGDPLPGTTVEIIDVYDNEKVLGSYTFLGSKRDVQFNISTDNFYFAGIHKIRAKFENSPANNTFIVINEKVDVNAISKITTPRINNVVQRGLEGFTVSGYVWDNGTGLYGLRVRLLLFNKTNDNVSYYLIGDPYAFTDSNGNFTININLIDLYCPRGEYYIKIDFNGSIMIPETPGINLITNFMTNVSSMPVSLNITAGTVITIDDYYTLPDIPQFPDLWFNKTTLYINGSLSWDNSAPIAVMRLNVTVQWKINGTVIAYNLTAITDASGNFIATIFITDNDNWPLYRSDTKIVVYFDAKVNNLDHAENSNYTSYL